jgi:membrane protease YdiL (CAAX protease family)
MRRLAFLFELSLAGVACAVGSLLGVQPLAKLSRGPTGVGLARDGLYGLVAALPLLLGLLLISHTAWRPFRRLRRLVMSHLVPLFVEASPGSLLAISVAAGVGEEVLFRGLIQQGLAQRFASPAGAILALAVASVLFGAAHWVTRTYALLAFAIGVYLGGLYWLFDSLMVPVVTHAAYDFFALCYLLRVPQKSKRPDP